MPDDKPSLDEKIVQWLGKEGYRLEYLAQRAFDQAGLTAVLGNFVNNAEGKPREIDVTASRFLRMQAPIVAVKVLCECKYSQELPWVLLTSGLRADLFADWASTPKSPNLTNYNAKIHEYADLLKHTWHYAEGQPFGHSIVQALKKDNRDHAFDALQKVANACWDYVEGPPRAGVDAYLIALPCMVVEAPLYFAHYDYGANDFRVNRIPYGRLSWAGCRGGTVVDVIHVDSLPDYAKAVTRTIDALLKCIRRMARFLESNPEVDNF